jgi:alpha-tubulin suppressor-like RCC1 family protein
MTHEDIKKKYAMVWSFGSNEMAELGVGHYNSAPMPERVRGLPKVKVAHISSGGKHTGIVTEDGKLWMCGSRKFEQLGIEKLMTSSIKSFKLVELMSEYKVVQVACGDFHTMCLTENGKIFVWGGSLHNVCKLIFAFQSINRNEEIPKKIVKVNQCTSPYC